MLFSAEMMEGIVPDLVMLVLLFFCYSFLGWCIEVTLKFIQYHRFINRGFLTGPVCPIYGAGAALITLCVSILSPFETSYGTTFVISLIICGLVEYLTSYVQEKAFHARWWDYSQKPMNLHGRIWIGNLILFGLGGVLIIHLSNPMLIRLLNRIPFATQKTVCLVLLGILVIDCLETHFILKMVKAGIKHSEADNTEEIRKEILYLFSDKNIFYRRFVDAYPEVVYRTERISRRLDAIQRETERLRAEAEQQYKELARALETPTTIRNRIITQQGELIDLLFDAHQATEQELTLKAEIDSEVNRLNSRTLLKKVQMEPVRE